MTKNSRAIFYLRTPAPSDDHAVLWYLPTCPEMRGLRTPPQTLLTLPRRSFFFPISTISLTPPACPRSRASLAQSFFTHSVAGQLQRRKRGHVLTLHSYVHVPMSMWYDGKTSVSPPQNSYELPFILVFVLPRTSLLHPATRAHGNARHDRSTTGPVPRVAVRAALWSDPARIVSWHCT